MTPEHRWSANETLARCANTEHIFFLAFNGALLSLSLLLGISGNLLVCWVVNRTKTLRTANNALLVNLAASDLLKCSVDTPLFLATLFWAQRRTEVIARLCCLLQFTYALCSCVQLLSLVGISVERFRSVAFPFKAEARRGRVRVWVVIIWLLGLVFAMLSLALSKDSFLYMMCAHMRPHETLDYHTDPFGVFVLVPVWGSCLVLIVIHYVRIFIVVRQHSNKIFDRGIQLKPTMSRQASGWQSLSRSVQGTSRTVAEPTSGTSQENRKAPGSSPEIVGAVCILTPAARELGQKRLEGKLAKRFGCIIIAVLLFWLPLVLCLLVSICSPFGVQDSLRQELQTSATVLTCVPAAIHPLIYSLLNRQFRAELNETLSDLRTCSRRRV